MIWRLTYFVNEARKTDAGWLVLGEPGLGPPDLGDEFDGVHHQDDGSEDVGTFRVLAIQEGSMSITGPSSVHLRRDDILMGEVARLTRPAVSECSASGSKDADLGRLKPPDGGEANHGPVIL